MDFSTPSPRRASEPALPMINVVFLLLIFFLMSAQIVAPPPLDVTPPEATNNGPPQEALTLHIDASGTLAFQDVSGDAVWSALASVEQPGETRLLIRADAQLPGSDLARALSRVSALGYSTVQLATVAP